MRAASNVGIGGAFNEACRYLHSFPWIQNPSLNLKVAKIKLQLVDISVGKYHETHMLQSFTSSRECLKGQSGSLHSLYFAKNRQVGIRLLSNW